MTESILTLTDAVAEALRQAVAHHQAGRWQTAEELYRAILEIQPNHPDANHNLGVLVVQGQQPAAGLPYLKAALETDPTQGHYWLDYIATLIQAGQPDLARETLEQGQAHGLSGDAVEALAVQLSSLSTFSTPAATSTLERKSIRAAPKKQPRAHHKPGSLSQPTPLEPSPAQIEAVVRLFNNNDYAEAEQAAKHLTVAYPHNGFGWKALGSLYGRQGQISQALPCLQKAVALSPNDFETHSNLGSVLREFGQWEEAIAHCHRALDLKPNFAEAHYNLSTAFHDIQQWDKAIAHCRQALDIRPDYPDAYNNLGNILKNIGQLAQAIASYRKALDIKPDYIAAHTNLLLAMNYTATYSPSECLQESRQYGRNVAQNVGGLFSTWERTTQSERLRIGLVSGDLKNHPVGYFLESLLTHLDPVQIELIAYPTWHLEDELTARLKPYFTAWKPLIGLNDETAARMIHRDGVHILFDLSGYTGHNRLSVFAWKPAPVQVSWLGYFATTGVMAIDYLLGDPYVLPTEEESHFTEQVWRLPETYLCFTPPDVVLEVESLPALSSGVITFGCFNNFAKINDAVVALWAQVLRAVPGSRLFLKTFQLQDLTVCETIRQRFATHSIAADRIILEGASPRAELLAAYNQMDIALDPFPYPGGVTSMEALWMGVPVLTRRGDRFLSHIGESIAYNAGLADWIAADDDDYVAKAVAHTANLECLATLRTGLRQQVLASPLFDAPRFARHFEAALWGMWKNWQNQQGITA